MENSSDDEALASQLDEALRRRMQEAKAQETTAQQLREQVRVLESRLVAKDAEIALGQNRMTKLQAQMAREETQAERQLKRLTEKNKKLQKEDKKKSESLLKSLAENDDLKRKLSQSEEQLSGRNKEMQELQVQIKEVEATIEKLDGQLKLCQEHRDKVEEETKEQFEDHINILESRLEEALIQNMELTDAQDHAAEELAGLRQLATQAKNDRQKILGLEQRLRRLSFEAKRAASSEDMEELKNQQEQADQDIKQTKRLLAEQANQVSILQNTNVELNDCLELEVARRIEEQVEFSMTDVTLDELLEESARFKVGLLNLEENNRELQDNTKRIEQWMKDQGIKEPRQLNNLETAHTQTAISHKSPLHPLSTQPSSSKK